jgi:hypothetical protein
MHLIQQEDTFKYNQQDVTLYRILYYCQCSICFGRFLRLSTGAQELYTQQLVCARLAYSRKMKKELQDGDNYILRKLLISSHQMLLK